MQCFAAFIQKARPFEAALSYADLFIEMCKAERYQPVRSYGDIRENAINAMLTLEDGAALEGNMENLESLYRRGYRMVGLLWNYPNEIGYPNFPNYEGLLHGTVSPFERETKRGLTAFGSEAVERMFALGMIVDAAHASDKTFYDVAKESQKAGVPFVVSHTASARVCPWSRNLTDGQLSLLADCGGVAGLNFCEDFLGGEKSGNGQREAILAHARHMIAAGGEDVLAIGSDFDGMPPSSYLPDASFMPRLFDELCVVFGERIAEKIARGNAERVLKDALKD